MLLLHLILFLDLLFYHSLLLLLFIVLFRLEEVLAVVVIAWMLLLHLLRMEVVIPNFILRVSARFPRARQRRLQSLLGDVEVLLIFLRVHAEVFGIEKDLFLGRFIVFIELFIKNFITLGDKEVSRAAVHTGRYRYLLPSIVVVLLVILTRGTDTLP